MTFRGATSPARIRSGGTGLDGAFASASDRVERTAILCEVMSEITVYTTTPCPYCTRVKRLLDAKGVQYSEVNMSRDPEARMELAAKTGMMTFPQVLIGDQLIGGYEETEVAARSGRLDELLAAA